LLGRARESWDFGRKTAGFLAQHQQTFDVVYMNAWPLFGPWEITRTARELGLPVVHHVQDVYPESLSTKLSPALFRLAAPPLLALDRRIVRRCAAVVLISQRMSQLYGRTRRMADRVRVVRNWVDATAFDAVHDRHTVCREYEVVPDRFTFLYLGNLSALSAVHSVIRAFARIPHAGKQLLIVGEGSTKAECQRLARELALPNILFRSEPDAGKVARIQTLADVCLMPTVRGGATASTPSKCISYMFSGKPILAAVDEQSDAADDIRQADCGWVCPPEDVEAIADAMQRAAALPADARAVLGRNARQFARQHFSRETGVTALADIILGAARTSAARA
jgi:glycosyltransferase involved in cell wall biosynthesis